MLNNQQSTHIGIDFVAFNAKCHLELGDTVEVESIRQVVFCAIPGDKNGF
jgi:hypothetical protein